MAPRSRAAVRRARGHVSNADIPRNDDSAQLLYDSDKPQPTPLYPEYHPSRPASITNAEKRSIVYYRQLRDEIQNGPFYTILDHDSDGNVAKSMPLQRKKRPASETIDPFNSMPKWSQRYTQKRRVLPDLTTRSYVLKFSPAELHATLSPTTLAPRAKTQPKINHGLSRNNGVIMDGPDDDAPHTAPSSEDEDAPTKPSNGKRKPTTSGEGNNDEQDELGEEDVDDEFDDEEDGGDYNAEQYFDDGGDDGGDDYDAGGDGTGYFE